MKYGKNLTLQQIIDACLQSDEEEFCDWDLEQDSSDEEEYIEPCFRSSHLITEFEPVRFVIYFNIAKKRKKKKRNKKYLIYLIYLIDFLSSNIFVISYFSLSSPLHGIFFFVGKRR